MDDLPHVLPTPMLAEATAADGDAGGRTLTGQAMCGYR